MGSSNRPLKSRIRKDLRDELDASGLEWSLVHSKRHLKIYIGPRFVGILPMDGLGSDKDNGALAVRAQVRRAIQEARDALPPV